MRYLQVVCQYIGAWVLSLVILWSVIAGALLVAETAQHEVAHLKAALPAFLATGLISFGLLAIFAFKGMTTGGEK